MAMTLDMAGRPDMSAFLRRTDDGRASLDLLVTGARCAGCISKIERAVSGLPGVESARLNLSTGRLAVGLADGGLDPGRIISALDRLGYPATPFDPGAALVQRDREGRRLILALAVAAFGAMNAMMFSVPIWAGLFDQELGPATRTMMMWMSAAVGAPCAVFAGMPFFESAWRSLRVGRANMDVPISVGVILTLAISFSETILHGRDAYFDAAVSLLFLLLIGRWLDHTLRARARSAAGDLLALQAPAASVVDAQGRERSVPLGDVQPGDLLRVRPGDRIPVDATLVEGEALLDNSLLTGESAPERVGRGQLCRAGGWSGVKPRPCPGAGARLAGGRGYRTGPQRHGGAAAAAPLALGLQLGLALDAAFGRGEGLQAGHGDRLATDHAFAVAAIVQPLQGGAHVLQLLLVAHGFGVAGEGVGVLRADVEVRLVVARGGGPVLVPGGGLSSLHERPGLPLDLEPV